MINPALHQLFAPVLISFWGVCNTIPFIVIINAMRWTLTSIVIMTPRNRPVNHSSPSKRIVTVHFPTLGIVLAPGDISQSTFQPLNLSAPSWTLCAGDSRLTCGALHVHKPFHIAACSGVNWAATPTRYDRGARGRYPDRGYCKSLFASKNIKKTNYASSKRCARTPQRAAVAVYVFCFLHGRASWAVRFLDDGFVPCYREIFNVILR